MKTCPWCGRKNLDSDDRCFNCERDLDVVPDAEEVVELEQEIRRTRVYKPPSVLRLVLISLIRKLVLVLMALGAFFIFALLAIWLSYDSETMALVVLAILGAAMLFALYYPDFRLSRRVGNRGVLVSIIANIILIGLVMPPVLWFLSRRGYIGGIGESIVKFWWIIPAYLVVGCLTAWLAARWTSTETANP